jgi:Ras GTPase-activating-like protein IQGAP2/3
LKELKLEISQASKTNFVLEKDVRYLDSRIALLIQNRMALDEDTAAQIDAIDFGSTPTSNASGAYFPDDRKKQHYGNMFFLLQTEVKYIAQLVKLVTLGEMDALMQCVMFTLFGNQFERREEGLLLTMFQV